MEFFFNRYRNLSVLAVVLMAQLLLLAYQVRTRKDVRLIRVWAVSGVMPMANLVDAIRSHTVGAIEGYQDLLDAKSENERLRSSNDKLKLENQFLKSELATADRAQALAAFQQQSPSRTLAARVIGNGTDSNSRICFIDRGSKDGVAKDMAIITPDGLVGVVTAAYPNVSSVRLITDSQFGAGVVSQSLRIHGVVKGQNQSNCVVEFIQNDDRIEVGEWFYTSGDDLMFPKGLPVGQVKTVRPGASGSKEILLDPSGLRQGLEEVLVVLQGVHQPIPDAPPTAQTPRLLEPPPAEVTDSDPLPTVRDRIGTDADAILEQKRRLAEAQGYTYGTGTKSPDFNAPVPHKTDPEQ